VWYIQDDGKPSKVISELLPAQDEHNGLESPVLEYDAPGDDRTETE